MAAEGMRLTRHYTSAPVCAPARGSLIQGRDQGHANIRDNSFDKAISNNHTLGTVMEKAGYFTACVGKWGVGGTAAPYAGHPNNRGFDYFYGYMEHLDGHQHYPGNSGKVFENTTPITTGLDHAYTTDLWTAKAKRIIQDRTANHPQEPFFLYLAYDAPHAQLQVPTQAYPAGLGVGKGLTWPLNTNSGTNDSYIYPEYTSLSPAAKRHASMIRRLDDSLGDILQTLRDLGIAENTMVVFTSDNGTHDEGGSGTLNIAADPRNFNSFGMMEGIKRDVWEGGIRMPTFAWWPGKIGDNNAATPARDSQRPSAFWDWMPTLADAAGVVPPAWSNGISLLPTLTATGTQQDKGYLYFEYAYNGTTPNYTQFPNHRNATRGQMQAVFLDDTDGKRYKGIRYNISSQDQNFLIYDVDADPGEGTDLAAAHPALQQRMKNKVLQSRIDGDYPRGYMNGRNAAPVSPENVVNGLVSKAYIGTWQWVPETATLTPSTTGTALNPDLSKRTQDENFLLEFTGFISVPTDGSYNFEMTTDSAVTTNSSGGMLWIHDANVIEDDFNHNGAPSTGTMRLAAGLHPIRILYKHATGTRDLVLRYSGSGISLRPVPNAAFFREDNITQPPVANPDSASTTGTAPINIPVLANDSPASISILSVESPQLGSAIINGPNINYTADSGKFGEDRFSYTITDGTLTAASEVTVHVLPPTNLRWIPLDETAGSVANDALGRPVGTLTNFPNSPWTVGKLGNALTFDGIDDKVILIGDKGITGTAARTVSFWINANATQVSGTRFDINLDNGAGYVLRAEFNASGIDFVTPSRSDLRGAGWVHCAIVVPSGATVSQVLAYLDGIPATATATNGSTAINTASTNDITIGGISDGSAARSFAGKIDDVRIYPRVLSSAEITSLATRITDGNLQSQWFYRHSGNDAPTASDWLADFDGDGFSARMEFALGGNPTRHSLANTPLFENASRFTFNRRINGISASLYVPETSEDLDIWFPFGTPVSTPHPNLADFDTVSVTLPASNAAKRFVRLRVDP